MKTVTTAANGYFPVNLPRQPRPKWRLSLDTASRAGWRAIGS